LFLIKGTTMKVHFSSLSDAQLSVILGRLAGQTNARLQDGQAWVGRPYSLVEPNADHREQVEKFFAMSTTCEVVDGWRLFTCDGDPRTSDRNPCRARSLGALLKTFPSGYVEID
jgi:hypothetical protein